jgi:hypothetical protein
VDTDSADQLASRIAAADRGEAAPPAPGGTEHAAPPPPDAGAPWREAVIYYGGIVRECLSARISQHWTNERLDRVGMALGRCAVHYRWDFADKLNHPLAGLLVSIMPLAWPIAEPYVMPHMKALTVKPSANEPPPPAAPKPPPAMPPLADVLAAAPPPGAAAIAGVDVGAIRLATPDTPNRVAPLEGNAPVS